MPPCARLAQPPVPPYCPVLYLYCKLIEHRGVGAINPGVTDRSCLGRVRPQDLHAAVGGTVINEEEFEVDEALGEDALDCCGNKLLAVIDWDQDGDSRGGVPIPSRTGVETS